MTLETSLASISAGARILLRKPKDETETKVLQMMETTVLRMAGLIDNVTGFRAGQAWRRRTLSRTCER